MRNVPKKQDFTPGMMQALKEGERNWPRDQRCGLFKLGGEKTGDTGKA